MLGVEDKLKSLKAAVPVEMSREGMQSPWRGGVVQKYVP
jgi:hypothetical protein